ncbi:uncharacterized protein LOC126571756 isoform X1 [Anopheles aquasalis]|uniref:uncharacterized protein LOC126571756 isoform X1 n=1 Tax=Anopheles aquasalis TaxID=42839 RepID=UPI00215AB99C|nr:uncharacterized protein LOC126571756 isoform X1 [Anopheles aquasalis]
MFLIVEIVNDKGEKDWKVAPKRWVCTSKNTQRPVLFWPDEFSAERQNQLAIEGTCKPLQSWMRRECVVKQEFPTYEEAQNELHAPLKHKELITEEEPEKLLNVEDASVESPGSPYASGSGEDASTLACIKSMLQSLITKSAQIEKQNDDVLQQNDLIEGVISLMHKKVESIEQNVVLMAPYKFDPMQTVEQLRELNEKLNDISFNAELVQWLLSNVGDGNMLWRIRSCLDLLCSLELQTKITFTHQSRSSPRKEPLVEHSNFIHLFKVVGKTSSEKVSDRHLVDFFKSHLKNSKQRFLISLNRKRVHSKKRLKVKKPPRNNVAIQHAVSSFAVSGSSQELNEKNIHLEEADIIVYDPIE